MATQEAPYDPYIPSGQQQQQGGQQQGGNARTQALQAVSCEFLYVTQCRDSFSVFRIAGFEIFPVFPTSRPPDRPPDKLLSTRNQRTCDE